MSAVKLARRGGAVRLTLSATVANDLGALEHSLKSLAERLGHPGCASGCDILLLQLEREFTVDNEVELNPQPLPPGGPVELNPQPLPPGETVELNPQPIPPGRVFVMIPDEVNNNIEAIQKALTSTVGKLGCQACCSGFDIFFQRELDMIAFDEKVNAQGFGRFR
jgi:hypothetical protein